MAAVGEMLLQARGISVSQDVIRDIIEEPTDSKTLAGALNGFDNSDDGSVWRGLFLSDFEDLAGLGPLENIAVVLREPDSTTGHAVIINGTRRGRLIIKDPFDQTSYEMTNSDFDKNWGLEVIVRWHPESK